jgi:outer membrane scaffolding protein for murein synthesis (MipA/OmpV family)
MKKFKLSSSSLAAAAAILVSTSVAAQEAITVPEPPQDFRNFIGLGVFGIPDYYGSSTLKAAVAPVARYSWTDTQYVQWLGPTISANLVPMKEVRAGPLIRFRQRRDDDVDDEIVKRMRPVASATEIGAFVAYHMPLDNNPLHKVVFYADVVGNTNNVYDGATGNIMATYYHPFEQAVYGYKLVGTLGFGMFFSSDHFNQRYFGVSGSDVALFPGRGGQPYRAEGGLTSLKIPFSLTTQVDKQWVVTLAGRWERLQGDAADSPVVGGRGNMNQWSIGAAAAYLF